MIQIYNTLTRQKEAFKPIEEGKVRVCVRPRFIIYSYAHWVPGSFDTIRRYLNTAAMT